MKVISEKRGLKNWVDIENEYYNELIAVKEKRNSGDFIDNLNEDFADIKLLFIEYLKGIDKNKVIKEKIRKNIYTLFNADDFIAETRAKFIYEMYKIVENITPSELNENLFLRKLKMDIENSNKFGIDNFLQSVNRYDNESIKKLFPFIKPSSQLILNFNYTNIAGNYTDYNYVYKISIHGELNSQENPIIFGFGDDVDKKYQEFEDLNDNRYLENFKSIAYLQTDNYKKLLEFIDSEEYQVFIFGHSCGISDRTMLNTIFEHDNCKSVKPFYHKREDGTDNYTEIVQNISRNFNDKKKFRDRVVNKTYCESLT